MNRAILAVLCALTVATPGCKIVYESETGTEIPVGPEGDDARNAARLEESFDSTLLPHVTATALGIAELRTALAAGLDEAGEAHGNRGAGMGAAWNFAVRGEGSIVEAKLDTSARTLLVDTDADGTGDVTVQLGPVIRGTALRDVAPFYKFDDFRDQIEFAKLARAINDRIKPGLQVPEGDLAGASVSFLGVVPLKKTTDSLVVTPVSIEFRQ